MFIFDTDELEIIKNKTVINISKFPKHVFNRIYRLKEARRVLIPAVPAAPS